MTLEYCNVLVPQSGFAESPGLLRSDVRHRVTDTLKECGGFTVGVEPSKNSGYISQYNSRAVTNSWILVAVDAIY